MEKEAKRFRALSVSFAISLVAAAAAAGCSSAPPQRPAYVTVLSKSSSPSRNGAAFDHPYRRFGWPIAGGGTLSSGFGMRNGAMHEGIDISAPSGTPVRAAGDGVVIFAGRLRGYGNVVIIRHDDHYVTIYAHDRSNYVREGNRVRRGQMIASVGSTGRTTGANLHFEVRRDNVARDPINYLVVAGAPPVGASFARGGGS
ncbi:MAG: M23 family metallopeptidase [Candidatus Binataceae bacterium]